MDMNYARVPSEETSCSDHDEQEQKEFLTPLRGRDSLVHAARWCLVTKVLTVFNICLGTFFIFSSLGHGQTYECVPGPRPPWSPVRNDGVIRNINTAYRPEKLFQSETSDDVEEAWESWLTGKPIEYDHLIILPKNDTETRLPITVDAFLDPGYSVYGLAVYHQMHCLNHIRKTFYGNRFFPNQSRAMVQFHKNHCFDMLRQSIMCHGDIAIMHWWNDSYSYIDDSGAVKLTEHYLSLTPSQQAEGAFAKWDTPVQCRDLSAINAWAASHAMEDSKYAATVGQIKKRTWF